MTEHREAELRELVAEHRATVITWDWKEQIPAEEVGAAAALGFVHMYTVDDTGGDSYAMVISKEPLSIGDGIDEAQQVFEMVEDQWIKEADQPIAHRPQQYRTLKLEIEILEEQDASIIMNELSKTMSKLETLRLEITNWRFIESPPYQRMEA